MKDPHYWGWPIAGYLFLGGLGGGITIISACADLLWKQGALFALGNLVAAVCLGLGSGLLIFELGQPLRFWRVFSKQKAVITFGAWILGLTILTDAAYFSFYIPILPWGSWNELRQVLAAVNLLLGLGVVTYTGVLLGSLKSRPFWGTPALPILFAVSGLSTGVAGQSLLAGAWSWSGSADLIAQINGNLHALDDVLLVFELVILGLYLGMMRLSARTEASRAASRWLNGSYSFTFWGGVIALGLVGPLVLYLRDGPLTLFAPIGVIAGGIFLRFLVVFSNDRPMLPGEEKYRSRLPQGDEPFLKPGLVK